MKGEKSIAQSINEQSFEMNRLMSTLPPVSPSAWATQAEAETWDLVELQDAMEDVEGDAAANAHPTAATQSSHTSDQFRDLYNASTHSDEKEQGDNDDDEPTDLDEMNRRLESGEAPFDCPSPTSINDVPSPETLTFTADGLLINVVIVAEHMTEHGDIMYTVRADQDPESNAGYNCVHTWDVSADKVAESVIAVWEAERVRAELLTEAMLTDINEPEWDGQEMEWDF